MPLEDIILTLSCQNRPGIVAALAPTLFEAGGNILDASRFDDAETERSFKRVLFTLASADTGLDGLRPGLAPMAAKLIDGKTHAAALRAEVAAKAAASAMSSCLRRAV